MAQGDIIQQGAEAVLTRENDRLIKNRVSKKYRLKAIDELLRKSRTKTEASLMRKASRAGVLVPQILDQGDYVIEMEFIDGKKIKDALDSKNSADIGREIGKIIAKLHNFGIIHGDLTTSNMILSNKTDVRSTSLTQKTYLIDFGLGFMSHRAEDKAVDLLLLKRALESTHFSVSADMWRAVLKVYANNYDEAKGVIATMDNIEKRGRYRKR